MKRLMIVIVISFSCASLHAQEIPNSAEQQLELLADAMEEETEDDSFLQLADHLRRHPVNLNIAEEGEMKELRILSDLQIENLLVYRRLFGNFIDLYELQAVPGWDVNTIRKLLPFIRVGASSTASQEFRSRLNGGEHMVLLRASRILEKSKGFIKDSTGSKYPGSPEKLMIRYRYTYKNLLQFGLLGEKDAGEQFLKGAQRMGFDFYTFFLFARKIGIIESLALGDFSVNLGQGLIHWQGLAFGKGGEITNVKRQSATLRPYNSAGEFFFHRGAGITAKKRNLEMTVFVSSRKLSANTEGDPATESESLSSFLTSGNHRTVLEAGNKNSVGQFTVGGNIKLTRERRSFRGGSFHVGFNGVAYRYTAAIQKRDLPYNLFAIRGEKWMNASVDYSVTWRNLHAFGELAIDKNMNKAMVQGLLLTLDHRADLSLLYRGISPQYQSMYGNAFTESSLPNNDYGFFAGITIRPANYWRISLYADVYSFPWLKFRVDAPSSGKDFLVQVNCSPARHIEWYTRFRSETKSSNDGTKPAEVNEVIPYRKQSWRTHFSLKASMDLTFRARVEASWFSDFKKRKESGLLGYFDLLYKPMMKPWSVVGRVLYFDTDSYDTRLYAYENDVMYGSSTPVFSGRGYRFYAIFSYDLNKKTTCWLKISQSLYPGMEAIGSGLDEIAGERKTEVKVQVRKFL